MVKVNHKKLSTKPQIWCLLSIDGKQVKAKIAHIDRSKFVIIQSEDTNHIGRVVDASEVYYCSVFGSKFLTFICRAYK